MQPFTLYREVDNFRSTDFTVDLPSWTPPWYYKEFKTIAEKVSPVSYWLLQPASIKNLQLPLRMTWDIKHILSLSILILAAAVNTQPNPKPSLASWIANKRRSISCSFDEYSGRSSWLKLEIETSNLINNKMSQPNSLTIIKYSPFLR